MLHACFAGDSSAEAVPTEMSNARMGLGNANASEFCIICYISHSPILLQNITVFLEQV